MISPADGKVCLSLIHKNKQVKVTLEFPERSDQTAKQEFIDRLKAACLEKIRLKTVQKEDLIV